MGQVIEKRSFFDVVCDYVRLEGCVESRCMVFVSVVFTVYALFGDDIRLGLTSQPADLWFSLMALICLVFFSAEIILKCIVQFDYCFSFYFILDFIATISLILDVTWIADILFQEENLKDGGERARSGRTARVGASLGRVVRVLRLVRVLKLYKAWFETPPHARDARARASAKSGPGQGGGGDIEKPLSSRTVASQAYAARLQKVMNDDWEKEEEDMDEPIDSESAVGKKLVAITTRKVIILVLTMLLVLPFLTPDSGVVFSSSAVWGADRVWEAFTQMQAGDSNLTQQAYEVSILKYIYYHNWYMGRKGCSSQSCSANSFAQAFWIGFAGTSKTVLQSQLDEASIREKTIQNWEKEIQQSEGMFDLGTLPSEVHSILSSTWDVHCQYGGLDHLGISLLKEKVDDLNSENILCPNDLRPQEKFRVTPLLISQSAFTDFHLVFFFDSRPLVRLQAGFGVLTTTFICLVLTLASMSFSSDANLLVLQPVERMVTKVKAIRDNPLLAIKMAESQLKADQVRKESEVEEERHLSRAGMKRCFKKCWDIVSCRGKEEEELMETVVLERTIVKLGSLLALGFGIAGVPIVASNMRSLNNASVNAMIPGSRVDCVIGIARIRNFNTATEVLQTKVMSFVNQIAEIVHGLVQEYNGGANRNNGDTFLLIWRLEEEEKRSALADMSVAAFTNMLAEVHRSPVLAQYRTHPGLQQRQGSNCRVDLSFGLHLGWAVEGAVGSEFKIDASYLSPNVSIAEAIERSTRMYGVSLLASETVVQTCTPITGSKLRLIDRVIIAGSRVPLQLHVLDLDPKTLEVRAPRRGMAWNVRQRFKARQLLEVHKQYKWAAPDLLDENATQEIKKMREGFPVGFKQLFNMGYQNYSEGEWEVAGRLLRRASDALGRRDGPSAALLDFMERPYNFKAPRDWRGVRTLPRS